MAPFVPIVKSGYDFQHVTHFPVGVEILDEIWDQFLPIILLHEI